MIEVIVSFIRKFIPFGENKTALHIITMNREMQLKRLIENTKDYFDVIRICDGGSSDGTKEIIKEYPNAEFYYREWDDDYAAQDNELLKQARRGDWIMIMDDDECPSLQLLEHLEQIIDYCNKFSYNMVSLPSLLVLNGEPECKTEIFIEEVKNDIRNPFRKYWLFKYDSTVKSYGTPHRSVESKKGWKVYDQPYPYFHYKSSEGFIINDCIHGWINPPKQEYSPKQAKEMYASLPEFKTSREIVPFLKSDEVPFKSIEFFKKYKDENTPIKNWWKAYKLLQQKERENGTE